MGDQFLQAEPAIALKLEDYMQRNHNRVNMAGHQLRKVLFGNIVCQDDIQLVLAMLSIMLHIDCAF